MKKLQHQFLGIITLVLKCIFGCKHTPILMANKNYNINFGNTAKALAVAASMPIVAIPIQDVQLLDYAVAHKTVNEGYGLTASVGDDIYLGLTDDPYTSDQQKQRDQYELDEQNWNEVVFEEVYGGSTAKIALHKDWINQQSYQVDAVVNLDLPEHGLSGPFRITSIKHILPQKKPEDPDLSDDYNLRPVTALFSHASDQVYMLDFDNGEQLGVTYQHPIYSVTADGWRLAGELAVGEKVLTKSGESAVVSSEKKEGAEIVYNLEIKELHNFLVGNEGITVHNSCIGGGKKVCPPPRTKSLVSANKFTNWINQFQKRTPIKGDPNAAWYKYQKRVTGNTEYGVDVPGTNKRMFTDGFDPNANALIDAKHTASNQTFDIDKYLRYEQNPSSVQLWERGIFESLDDEFSKYGKIIRDEVNDVAELHIKMSGDKLEARALFTYLGSPSKFNLPVKILHIP